MTDHGEDAGAGLPPVSRNLHLLDVPLNIRHPIVHELKCWPEYFQAILDGRKTFEVRKADRDFRVGDTLHLREFVPPTGAPDDSGDMTGREIRRVVSYMLAEASPFAFPGFVVMGLAHPAPASAAVPGELQATLGCAIGLAKAVAPKGHDGDPESGCDADCEKCRSEQLIAAIERAQEIAATPASADKKEQGGEAERLRPALVHAREWIVAAMEAMQPAEGDQEANPLTEIDAALASPKPDEQADGPERRARCHCFIRCAVQIAGVWKCSRCGEVIPKEKPAAAVPEGAGDGEVIERMAKAIYETDRTPGDPPWEQATCQGFFRRCAGNALVAAKGASK